LEHLLPLTSVERLEFYADLRTVCMRMEEMNLRLPDAGRISLEIVGPEALSIFDPGAVDLSARESRLYFVRERDSLAAGTIVSFLRRHPEKKALIFYGNGHLIKNRVRKDHSGVLDGEEAMGFYLGRHLKAAFGDSAVFTIGQIGRARSRLDLDAFGGRDAFLRSGDAPWGTPPAGDDDTDPGNFDAFIVRDGFMVQAHSLRHAASGRILDAALALRAFATPHRAGAMGNRLYLQSTNTLAFFAETTWTTTEEWSAWIAGNRAAALARMHSGAMRQEYAARGARLLGTREFGTVIDELIDLGFDPRAGSPRMGHAEWDSLVTAQWPQILLLNAIAVLWVGDAQEQATARDYLARTTGENFAAPAEYLKWWRKRFYGVAY
jgi:hypothetical protein